MFRCQIILKRRAALSTINNCLCPFIPQRMISLKKGSSFLSDREGVQNFVELLSSKERAMLSAALTERQRVAVNEKNTSTDPPDFKQLRLIFFLQALPFIGFGFLDNLIMIIAGDYIDATIGVTLGISTMAAAGLGNAVSDVAGIGSAWYIETIAGRIGSQYPKLSEVQSEMPRTRWCVQLARAFGITFGCILGMFPLLFLPGKKSERNSNT
ncbi:Transmembrane protein 65-like protein [Leptotrombidium deliense]|uniref:Transmembrane protein 65-like protein n=1 Tax=Leptotrombidium deliense TaxID=299467 RepID=A0A443SNQ8_9ACAR|nr:Transmembrane protein 65-like protein [Leptotrombidium deliense]